MRCRRARARAPRRRNELNGEQPKMDFAYSPRTRELQEKVTAFMQAHVYPAEAVFQEEVEANRRAGNPWIGARVMETLKGKARAQGLWNLFLPESELGAGLTNSEYAPLCEIMG